MRCVLCYPCRERGDGLEKLTIKHKRMLQYFIEAAQHIIDRDGFDNVTIRKISEEAGYNSSTIYNYYEDLEHLLQFACMEYLVNYQKKLLSSIKGMKNPKEIYFATWTLFASESYEHPKVFYQLFFTKHKDKIYKTFYRYLEIFDIKYADVPQEKIFSFIMLPDLVKRHTILLEGLAAGGYIKQDRLESKADMLTRVFESMLSSLRLDPESFTKEEFIDRIILYSKILLNID